MLFFFKSNWLHFTFLILKLWFKKLLNIKFRFYIHVKYIIIWLFVDCVVYSFYYSLDSNNNNKLLQQGHVRVYTGTKRGLSNIFKIYIWYYHSEKKTVFSLRRPTGSGYDASTLKHVEYWEPTFVHAVRDIFLYQRVIKPTHFPFVTNPVNHEQTFLIYTWSWPCKPSLFFQCVLIFSKSIKVF